jgi:uncharacterized protein DUF3485
MVRWIPVILGAVAILGFTIVEARMTSRFEGSDMTEEQFAQLLEHVPKDIGEWEGEDLPVQEQVQKTAGARGYVSRRYRNSVSGDTVTVWLIVGHARDICRHTPDICYPSSGFKMRAPENARHQFNFERQSPADFYTNTFVKEDATGRELDRVFWSWYKPTPGAPVKWEAPKIVRWEFGNARSLYKLYFTSAMKDYKESVEQSPCNKFAELFLPVVDKALSAGHDGSTPGADTTPADSTPAVPPVEAPAEEPAAT